MTLEEAIERQEEIIRTGTLGYPPTAFKAIRLGIEALNRELDWRGKDPGGAIYLLPGETK